MPAIVFLLLAAGLVAGPVTGVPHPDALFGGWLSPMVSLGVAVILFEGSLNLRLRETSGLRRSIRNLISIGALINAGVIAAATHWLIGLSRGLSLLFGALMSVTGPTVIKPLLRSARPSPDVARVFGWEGIVLAATLDPSALFAPGWPALALFAVLVLVARTVSAAIATATMPHGRLHLFTEGRMPEPGPGWRITSLLPGDTQETKRSQV